MYRDTFRAVCLCTLGRAALDQEDREAASAAFHQAETHLRGRHRTLGGGFLLTQALAGRSRAERSASLLDEAAALFEGRHDGNWSWFWLCETGMTVQDLHEAARVLGRTHLRERLEAREDFSLPH